MVLSERNAWIMDFETIFGPQRLIRQLVASANEMMHDGSAHMKLAHIPVGCPGLSQPWAIRKERSTKVAPKYYKRNYVIKKLLQSLL